MAGDRGASVPLGLGAAFEGAADPFKAAFPAPDFGFGAGLGADDPLGWAAAWLGLGLAFPTGGMTRGVALAEAAAGLADFLEGTGLAVLADIKEGMTLWGEWEGRRVREPYQRY